MSILALLLMPPWPTLNQVPRAYFFEYRIFFICRHFLRIIPWVLSFSFWLSFLFIHVPGRFNQTPRSIYIFIYLVLFHVLSHLLQLSLFFTPLAHRPCFFFIFITYNTFTVLLSFPCYTRNIQNPYIIEHNDVSRWNSGACR